MPHSSSSSPVTDLPIHFTFPSLFFPLVSQESWRNQYINLSLFFLTSIFLLAWISGFLIVDHDHDLGWGAARRAVGFTELWGRPIRFSQVAYSGVLLLWLRFIVGLKLELRVGLLLWLGFGVGLLLWLGFGVGLKSELGVGLKLEGSFPFLSLTGGVWLCRKGLRIRRGTSST